MAWMAKSICVKGALWSRWSPSCCSQKLCFRACSLPGQTLSSVSLYFYYPSCWKFAHIQLVTKKGDRSNPSNHCPKALISCLSKAFKSVLKKIIRHLLAHNHLSDFFFYIKRVLAKKQQKYVKKKSRLLPDPVKRTVRKIEAGVEVHFNIRGVWTLLL